MNLEHENRGYRMTGQSVFPGTLLVVRPDSKLYVRLEGLGRTSFDSTVLLSSQTSFKATKTLEHFWSYVWT
jgi:hypothetical protein